MYRFIAKLFLNSLYVKFGVKRINNEFVPYAVGLYNEENKFVNFYGLDCVKKSSL